MYHLYRLNKEVEALNDTLALLTIFPEDEEAEHDPNVKHVRGELEKRALEVHKLVSGSPYYNTIKESNSITLKIGGPVEPLETNIG